MAACSPQSAFHIFFFSPRSRVSSFIAGGHSIITQAKICPILTTYPSSMKIYFHTDYHSCCGKVRTHASALITSLCSFKENMKRTRISSSMAGGHSMTTWTKIHPILTSYPSQVLKEDNCEPFYMLPILCSLDQMWTCQICTYLFVSTQLLNDPLVQIWSTPVFILWLLKYHRDGEPAVLCVLMILLYYIQYTYQA